MAAERTKVYFVSDVHLGLQVSDPEGRERRFVEFLRSIRREDTLALFMLGDIYDFWYEWKHVVPKGYVRVLSALCDLVDSGVEVNFFCGNHDTWAYGYFESLGMHKLVQPAFVTIDGKVFCLGHGDAVGKMPAGYSRLYHIFNSPFLQWCFTHFIHPNLAIAFGNAWSRNNRLARRERYQWKGEDEQLVKYARGVLKAGTKVDYFIFGHFHISKDILLEGSIDGGGSYSSRLIMLDSWIDADNYFCL